VHIHVRPGAVGRHMQKESTRTDQTRARNAYGTCPSLTGQGIETKRPECQGKSPTSCNLSHAKAQPHATSLMLVPQSVRLLMPRGASRCPNKTIPALSPGECKGRKPVCVFAASPHECRETPGDRGGRCATTAMLAMQCPPCKMNADPSSQR